MQPGKVGFAYIRHFARTQHRQYVQFKDALIFVRCPEFSFGSGMERQKIIGDLS